MWSGIKITKYLNMHKSQYKFAKKRNKWDVTIKSIKKPLMEKKVVNIKKIHQIRYKIGERERINLFFHEQLRRNMGERWKWSKKKFIRKLSQKVGEDFFDVGLLRRCKACRGRYQACLGRCKACPRYPHIVLAYNFFKPHISKICNGFSLYIYIYIYLV